MLFRLFLICICKPLFYQKKCFLILNVLFSILSPLTRLESAIPMLLETLATLPDVSRIAVAFPDDGAFKRFHQFFPQYNTITCVKIREGNTRIVKVKEG